MRYPSPLLIFALALLFATPLPALAQLCTGSGASPGEFALNGQVTFQDGETGWGLQSAANLPGPLGFGAGFGTIDQNNIEGNWIISDAWAVWEIPVDRISVCPRLGVIWSTWNSTFDGETTAVDEWAFPLGISAGLPFEIRGQATIPTLEAGVQWARFSIDGPGAGEELERTSSGSDLYMVGGLTVLFERLFVRGEVRLRSDSSSSLAFRSGLGIRF